MLVRLVRRAEDDESGFTLIELLVVIIIIGILAAIAIPVFLNQRQKGYDAAAKSDARSMATAEETYLTDNSAYIDSDGSNPLTNFKQSTGATTKAKATGATGFCVVSKSQSGKYFIYDSQAGGLSGPSAAFPTTALGYPAGGSCAAASGGPASF